MARQANYANGVLVSVLDSTTGFTTYNPDGSVASQRGLTAAETDRLASDDAAATADTNSSTLRARAQAALTSNATFLALASPTNAQVVAQVQRLTKQNNAQIRLLLSQVSDISDTA